jgi:phage terminase large subunit GpA-like protein
MGEKGGGRRNEALDLSVYSLALVIVLGAERLNWKPPPVWAAEGAGNAFAIKQEAPDAEGETGETPPPSPAPARNVQRRAGEGPGVVGLTGGAEQDRDIRGFSTYSPRRSRQE